MNGAQLWMGSVPKELDADAISTAFVTLGAPRPTAVALRRSTYRVSGCPGDAPVGFALVDFASAEDASIALETCANATFKAKARVSRDASTSDEDEAAVECIPETTLTFHLRRAAETLRKRVSSTSFKTAGADGNAADGNRTREPDDVDLAAQLAPLDCAQLRARLVALNAPVSDDDERRWRDEGGTGLARLRLVERLCAAHGEPIGKGENTQNTHGNAHDGNRTRDARRRVWTKADPAAVAKPISMDAIARMLRCLAELGSSETTVPGKTKAHRRWPRSAVPDRAGVIASDRYLSLTNAPNAGSRPRRKLERYRWIWDECKALLASVAGDEAANAFDGLAVTHGVRGSPHVDSMDAAPQFACSLGDFRAMDHSDGCGGCLCVETSMHSVCAIDTKNVIVSIDGRKVHWVDPRYVGDRWSVVWYRRDVGATEPVVDGGVVPRWWAREEKSSWVHAKNPAVDPEAADADDKQRVKRHKRPPPHVPFHDSKLTALLAPALGGNSKTAVVVTCAQEHEHAAETTQSLRFGEKCSSVETRARVGADALADAISKLNGKIADCEEKIRAVERWETVKTTRRDAVEGTDEVVMTSKLVGAEDLREELEAMLAERRALRSRAAA